MREKNRQTFLKITRNFEIEKIQKEEKIKKNLQKSDFSLANFLNLGYYLIAPLVLGAFFGFFIDNLYKTMPKFTLVFIFLGTLATFYNLWKLTHASH